jgi:hypothetical protein
MHSGVAYPSHSQTLRQNQKIIFLWSRYIPDNTFMKLEKRVVFPSANQASDGGLLSTECRSGVIIHVGSIRGRRGRVERAMLRSCTG